MVATISPDQIDRVVRNQHDNPFEVLGPHQIEQNGVNTWVVRAYLPNASAAWVVQPEQRQEHLMQAVHHPHFLSALSSPRL